MPAATATQSSPRARRPGGRAEDVAGLGGARAALFVAPALIVIALFLLFQIGRAHV